MFSYSQQYQYYYQYSLPIFITNINRYYISNLTYLNIIA
jgi:hypothetical protein